jgi:hypothetical protein
MAGNAVGVVALEPRIVHCVVVLTAADACCGLYHPWCIKALNTSVKISTRPTFAIQLIPVTLSAILALILTSLVVCSKFLIPVVYLFSIVMPSP